MSTTTDYIITKAVSAPLVSNSLVHNHHPLNSSDHLPLSLSLNLSAEINCEPPVSKCLDWQRGSRDGFTSNYATCINGLLGHLIEKKYASISEFEEEICFVSTTILDTASSIIPIFKPKTPRKRFVQDHELNNLSRKCKEVWKRWHDAGLPSEGVLMEEKKNFKQLTQRCVNKCSARIERQAWRRKEQLFKIQDASKLHSPSLL